jgi:hypothetical protein
MQYRQHFESTIESIRREGRYRVFIDLELRKVGGIVWVGRTNDGLPFAGRRRYPHFFITVSGGRFFGTVASP